MEVKTMELPIKEIKSTTKSPEKTIIYSKPKVGKSEACRSLPGSYLILDLERGTKYFDCVKVDIPNLAALKEVGKSILEKGKPYKYGVVDTLTKLEDMCLIPALQMYKNTPIGKNFTGSNVLELANGAGYQYLREAMKRTCEYIETLFERVIYLGHLKVKYLDKSGKEVMAAELDLTGKIKSMMSADVDAIGLMYRDGNKNIVTFKTTDEVICGARPGHLKNSEFVLTEMVDGKLISHWDKIFLD